MVIKYKYLHRAKDFINTEYGKFPVFVWNVFLVKYVVAHLFFEK